MHTCLGLFVALSPSLVVRNIVNALTTVRFDWSRGVACNYFTSKRANKSGTAATKYYLKGESPHRARAFYIVLQTLVSNFKFSDYYL